MVLNKCKDKTIQDVVEKLFKLPGSEQFQVIDHWEGDLMAIGICSKKDKDNLVYISTYNKKDGFYDLHLELPSLDSSKDIPYVDGGHFKSVNFDRLVEIVKKHLIC